MGDDGSTGARLRGFRRRRGLTQEQLAEAAGLSPGVVKKIERGGTARVETYHALARALRVRTSALFEPAGPRQNPRADDDNVDLLALRRVISPAVTLSGRLVLDDAADEEPDLDRLRATATAVALAYHRDHYPRVAELLPELIRSAHTAIDHFDNGTERDAALALRSEALQLAGRYLTQVRAYDLAHLALRDAARDAARIGDRLNAASAIIGQGWILLRQTRFDEAERLAADTADEVEPRISRASREQLAAWGWLLLRAAAAAARNNRPDESKELVQLARTAGAALGAEVTEHLRGWGTFGPLTVDLKAIEAELVAERPDLVLEMTARLPRGVGRATSDNWNRHRLDVARAHAMLRHGDEATDMLVALRRDAPEWLRHQRLAATTFEDVLKTRKRSLTGAQRQLAEFLAVDG
ncbi:helix-turn-helix domain-containing protein [Streptomyces sp. CMB-StM0423]|uniref:helix-turn-helix domain-containing protein n=1 Tax=Streptomyces sp. CMB-StM0423 TaxID=2059884 RepID=UPI000C712AEE|nr:helix-turn-helix transcriptional regulator [Streptomyces sp. CMB-StM0423]AUH43053.1 XRE family transcriptional regulator [Streptomyces sp. CMB-StM0423]